MPDDLLFTTADYATDYLNSLPNRAVIPTADAIAGLAELGGPLPVAPSSALDVLTLLHTAGSPATVASAGSRYFGFVTGGSLPAALAANWLAGAWDQNVAFHVMSPTAAALESAARAWVLDVLGLPAQAAVGFVTGATMANLTALAAARHALLERAGWNVETQGLFGAPPIRVVVGDEVHVSLTKALSLLGFGRERVLRVPVDSQGRMRADHLPELGATDLVCIQAGNVNTGAFDPATAICERANAAGAWVHVDGAFGLWLAAEPTHAHLAAGITNADSWATDAHKWLNVPYDSGLAICRDPAHLVAAMATTASYLITSEYRDSCQFTPELSRRARGTEIWAALRALGRDGLSALLRQTCDLAVRFAAGLDRAGYTVLNEVVANQVLVAFGDADYTRRVIAAVQNEGTCWCGGTVWQGHTAMRISVSSWATTAADVDMSLAAILRCAEMAR